MFIKVLLASLLAGGSFATAGETAVVTEAKAPVGSGTPRADNPLSFFGGKVTFDFQERVRGEIRESNFDFNITARLIFSHGRTFTSPG